MPNKTRKNKINCQFYALVLDNKTEDIKLILQDINNKKNIFTFSFTNLLKEFNVSPSIIEEITLSVALELCYDLASELAILDTYEVIEFTKNKYDLSNNSKKSIIFYVNEIYLYKR